MRKTILIAAIAAAFITACSNNCKNEKCMYDSVHTDTTIIQVHIDSIGDTIAKK